MQAIDDKVWRSIPPNTGRLGVGTSGLILCLAVGVALAAAGIAVLDRYGLFRPQVAMQTSAGGGEVVFV